MKETHNKAILCQVKLRTLGLGLSPMKLVIVIQWVRAGNKPKFHQRRPATESEMNLRARPMRV